MKAHFWKAYAEGNSYVIFDRARPIADLLPWSTDPRRGLGGDGVLLAQWRTDGTVGMRVFNADGTEAPMCGNGARCLAALTILSGRAREGSSVTVTSAGGEITHRLDCREPLTLTGTMQVPADPVVCHDQDSFRIDLGTPHCVIFCDLANVQPESDGPRWERTRKGGTNVMFAHIRGPGELDVIPWERGVGVTLGCATGAAASAIAAARSVAGWPDRAIVRQPGGTVGVEWLEQGRILRIRGTVDIVAEGTLTVPRGR